VECWIRLKPDRVTGLPFEKSARGIVRGILCADYFEGEPLNIGLYKSRPFFMFGWRGIMADSSLLKQPDASSQDPWHVLDFSERAHLAFVYEKEKREMRIYINGKLNCSCFAEPLMHPICYLQVFSDHKLFFHFFIFLFSFLNICFHLKVGHVSPRSGFNRWSLAEGFNGMVGALRLWNHARSDICKTMYCDIDMFPGKLQYCDLLRKFSSAEIVTISECRNM
jgi:hypothetical protein